MTSARYAASPSGSCWTSFVRTLSGWLGERRDDEAACAHLKRQYDGYHFSKHCEDIYNPFSLFNAFDAKEYKNFWFSTGTPTFLIDLLQETDFDVRQLEGWRLQTSSLMPRRNV